MPKVIYEESEVYLTTNRVKTAEKRDKGLIAVGLIKDLLANGQSKDATVEAALSRVLHELIPIV